MSENSAPRRVIRTWHMDSRRWAAFRPRAGDIVVATYPKCGTTWMQQIVSLLIFQSAEPRPVMQMAPWIDARFLHPLNDMIATVEAQTHRRSLKSHLPFDALPHYRDVRYIHVARDGLDALMSWHNHSLRYKRHASLDAAGMSDDTVARPYPRPAEDPRAFFREWMGLEGSEREGDVSAAAFFDTEKSYWSARRAENLLLVHYNDLLADLDGEMRRVASFLQIETPAALWPRLVDAATFASMKREGAALLPTAEAGFDGGPSGFLYAGRNERWREALREEDAALYRARAAREMSASLNQWLAQGRRGGDPRAVGD